jgi:hypothetical protein
VKWRGPKTRGWERIRAQLSRLFFLHDVVSCELRLTGCWGSGALGFSHKLKRRKLTSEQLYDVALLCNPCHDQIENLPEEKKIEIHDRIAEVRGWNPSTLLLSS